MFKLIIVGTVIAAASAFQHPINQEIVKHIRETQTKWTPMEPSENPLRHWTAEEIRARLGTILQPPVADIPSPAASNDVLPQCFDSRTQWGNCVHAIRDQAACGSCWAFGATETLSDRFCIASNKSVDVVLSPEYLVSCDSWNMGCNGGILPWAWSFLTTDGAVTDSCSPYTSN